METDSFVGFREKYRNTLIQKFGRKNVCPFWGMQNAKIVSISQAPSASVVRKQHPFADKSGKRLREEWYQVSDEVFYDPGNFYFTAIGMYYPGRNEKGGDLKPSLALAREWLTKELTFLHPNLYLIVGRLASTFFFPKETLTNLVMTNQTVNGQPALVLPHPSPANIQWFKKNPHFEEKRIATVRKYVHEALDK